MKIALVAGEVSGDILGAGLMRSLRQINPDVQFIGVGGPLMIAEGMQSFFPMERLAVMGLVEVLGRLPELILKRHNLKKWLIQEKPDIFIGIDAPDFNLSLELKLKKAGIRTVHYVSPSVWAWRQRRVIKIRQACDLILVLFPFEVEFYKNNGVPVCFVGHPLADQIPIDIKEKSSARASLALKQTEGPFVALMPGSRRGEVEKLAPLFLDTAELVLKKYKTAQFLIPSANLERHEQLNSLLSERKLPIHLVSGRSHDVLAASDAVLIASGTATLEALLFKVPMVVAYKMAAITYSVLRRLVKSRYISLPNLLIGKAAVPELLQEKATPENLFSMLDPLLFDATNQVSHFSSIHTLLKRDASNSAAKAIIELLGNKSCK